MFRAMYWENHKWVEGQVGSDNWELYSSLYCWAVEANASGERHIENVCVIDLLTGEVVEEAHGEIGEYPW